jgi:arylsulfatase A-like enzyme
MRWQQVPNAEPLGKAFAARGYQTASLGKIWHAEGEPHGDRFDLAWTPGAGSYARPEHARFNSSAKPASPGGPQDGELPPITECAEVPDDAYRDGQTAAKAVAVLREFGTAGKPFMLAVGFSKPRLPFNAPKRYWDLYDPAVLSLAAHPDLPAGMPELAYNNNPNFHSYDYGTYAPLPKDRFGRMPDATARHLIHAYAAAASYADACVGRVLDELERLGLAGSTLVVLWGDHGFFLGELNQWSKHSNFERAARSPLIIRAPGLAAGAVSEALVGTVDILPTLLDVTGLPPLAVSDGTSLKPLLKDPATPWAEAAWHCFPRGKRIGFAVRTRQARDVEWREGWSLDAPLFAREFYRLDARGFADEVANEAENARAVRWASPPTWPPLGIYQFKEAGLFCDIQGDRVVESRGGDRIRHTAPFRGGIETRGGLQTKPGAVCRPAHHHLRHTFLNEQLRPPHRPTHPVHRVEKEILVLRVRTVICIIRE